MENEQCGITRVLLRLPLVIVIGKYVAYQTIGGLPSGCKRYDLCRVCISLVLSSIFHVVEWVISFSWVVKVIYYMVVYNEKAGVEGSFGFRDVITWFHIVFGGISTEICSEYRFWSSGSPTVYSLEAFLYFLTRWATTFSQKQHIQNGTNIEQTKIYSSRHSAKRKNYDRGKKQI